MQMLLSDALLRRKELAAKVVLLSAIRKDSLFENIVVRKHVAEGIDDVVAKVPKLAIGQVTAELDHYSKALRMVDSVIQKANWTTSLEVDGHVLLDFADRPQATKTPPPVLPV